MSPLELFDEIISFEVSCVVVVFRDVNDCEIGCLDRCVWWEFTWPRQLPFQTSFYLAHWLWRYTVAITLSLHCALHVWLPSLSPSVSTLQVVHLGPYASFPTWSAPLDLPHKTELAINPLIPKYLDLNSPNLHYTKCMKSVTRIESFTNFNPNKRSPAKFSTLYYTELAINRKENFAFDRLLGLKGWTGPSMYMQISWLPYCVSVDLYAVSCSCWLLHRILF